MTDRLIGSKIHLRHCCHRNRPLRHRSRWQISSDRHLRDTGNNSYPCTSYYLKAIIRRVTQRIIILHSVTDSVVTVNRSTAKFHKVVWQQIWGEVVGIILTFLTFLIASLNETERWKKVKIRPTFSWKIVTFSSSQCRMASCSDTSLKAMISYGW